LTSVSPAPGFRPWHRHAVERTIGSGCRGAAAGALNRCRDQSRRIIGRRRGYVERAAVLLAYHREFGVNR
jgi:hypothetical protein